MHPGVNSEKCVAATIAHSMHVCKYCTCYIHGLNCFLFPRLGCIFWATSFPGSLAKIITAQMDGSNITVITDNGILYICTLA